MEDSYYTQKFFLKKRIKCAIKTPRHFSTSHILSSNRDHGRSLKRKPKDLRLPRWVFYKCLEMETVCVIRGDKYTSLQTESVRCAFDSREIAEYPSWRIFYGSVHGKGSTGHVLGERTVARCLFCRKKRRGQTWRHFASTLQREENFVSRYDVSSEYLNLTPGTVP